MQRKTCAALAAGVMLLAQLACNVPTMVGGVSSPSLPAPNQTLTALFSITPNAETATSSPSLETATATLPPVITATLSGDINAGGGQAATATQAPIQAPTNTRVPSNNNPTATTAPTKTNVPVITATRVPATNTPVASATVPNNRTRVQVVANYLNTPPTLDGDWSEWKDVTQEYPANNVVYGAKNWTGADDLSASFHVGWDNNNLYIAVKVHDDKYVQNSSGENIYLGDSVEVLLDSQVQADYYYNKLSPDDFQLGLSPGFPDPNTDTEAYLWYPNNIAGRRPQVKIAAKAEAGGYRLEAAIPWSVFETTPSNGMHLGFALSVSDNDNNTKDVQESMVSNDTDRNLVDPTSWGDLLLKK